MSLETIYAAPTYAGGSFMPPADDSHWVGSVTLGWKGFFMPDTLITDDVGVVKFRNTANDANVGIAAGHAIFGTGTDVYSWAIVYAFETMILADNVERFGTASTLSHRKTTAAFTSNAIGLMGRSTLNAANTQNYTHAKYGMVGTEGALRVEAGATGVISNAVSLLARCEVFGATFTNWKGLYIEAADTTGGVITNAYGVYVDAVTAGATLNYALYLAGGQAHIVSGFSTTLTPSVTAAGQTLNAAPTATTLTMANGQAFTGTAGQIRLPAIVPVANGGGITLTGLNLSQGAITNAADSEAITVKQIVVTGAAGVALATGVYTWSGIDITTPAQAANGAVNLGYGLKITGGAVAGAATAAQYGIYINMPLNATASDWNYNDAIYIASGRIRTQHGQLILVTPALTAANQSVNPSDASQANTVTGAGGKTFTGIGLAVVLPAFIPVAVSNGMTLTGLKMSQGAISNAADTGILTVKQIAITGAAMPLLDTGIYYWTGLDITTPAQPGNAGNHYGRGIQITCGAKDGAVGSYQRGIDITMAAATDNAIYVGTGQSYFGGNIFLADGATIGQAAGPLLTFSDTNNMLGLTTSSGVNLFGIGTNVVNTGMTVGITILHPGGSANEMIALKQVGVAHGITTLLETDTLGYISSYADGVGGLKIRGATEAVVALSLSGWGVTDDVTKTTTSNAYVIVSGAKKTGTTVGATGAGANILAILDANENRFIFDQGGKLTLTSLAGFGAATLNIYGNATVTDATERAIVLSVLNASAHAWLPMITLTPNVAAPVMDFNSRPISNMILAASQKVNPTSGVAGFSVVSTALTLGSAGSIIIPVANMAGAADDAARDVLAGNVSGAIAGDSAAGFAYIRIGAAWYKWAVAAA